MGGSAMDGMGGGYFLNPTIINDTYQRMLTTQEEIFAPVVGWCKSKTAEEAVERANDYDV
jgi:succinate-semialdehyde dehydrogenase/glutarate-semialdehyde dehydrogenase